MPDKNSPQWGEPAPNPPEAPQPRRRWVARHKILTTLIAIIGLIAVISIAKTSGGGRDETSSGERQAETQKEDAVRLGTPVRDGKFEFTVTKVAPGVQKIGGEFGGEKAQGQFILTHVTVKNTGSEAQTFDGSSQKLFDANDRTCSADTEAAMYLDESQSFLNEINPGSKVKGIVVFDVPNNVTPVKMELHDSPFSDGVNVNLTK